MASLTSIPQNIQQSLIDCYGPKQTTIDLVGGILCKICRLTFATKQSYDSHYRSHGASTEIIYTCNICYKEVVGYPNFRGHCYTSHVIKERFQCEHCLKQFSKVSNLKDHVNRIHKFKCPTCRKEFPSKKEMLLHQIIHDNLDQPPYNCNTCKIEIDTADDCKEHVEKHLKFLYFCPICNDNISEKENAADHMKKHFGNVLSEDKNEEETPQSEDTSEEFSGIMCQFCSVILGDRVKFDAHFSCKHGDEDIIYMCVECGKSFEKYSVFKSHCYEHAVKNRYKCEICNKSFPRLSMLAAHTAACQVAGSARGQKVFACPVCSHRFASMWRLREHLRVAHDMHRHLPCPHEGCDRTFENPKELILHQQSHEIKNHNYCSQCRFVFSNMASCERHIDMHKKKVFFCPICKRNAKDKKVIMNHISQHFEVVSHLCRICGKISNSKKSLIDHLKIHKKVKSYSCTHCNKSFVKPSQLEQHVNTHTGIKPYKCPICVKSFSNYPNWVKHVRRMHHQESIYIKNPTIDQTDPENIDKEDDIMKTTVTENGSVKSNSLFNNEICTDNKKVNNNYQVSNTNEQISDMNIDQNITEVHTIPLIDINHDNTVTKNNKDSAVEIMVDKKCEVSNEFLNKSHIDEKKSNIVQANNMKCINIINKVDHTVSSKVEPYSIETAVDKENGIIKDNQKMEDVEQGSTADEEISNTPNICSKPYKCPICEKTFAKYSYMSKHIGRVHHIRSIDIKHLIIDHKDNHIDDEGSTLETSVNEENEISPDTAKSDNDEHVYHTDRIKIQINSSTESHLNGSKPYKCPMCDKSFAKYPYMTKHVRKIHHKDKIGIKNLVNDPAVVDEVSAMETGFDEENEISTPDISKEDIDCQFINLENQNINKPHKCPICEKTFAKYPYMTKHVRKVHNKKITGIKNANNDHKEILDEEVSTIETSIDGEYDISIDNIKDDNGVQFQKIEKFSNVEHLTNNGPKPYKCPTCEKSFAKHSYMSKHVRTVHNKKGHIEIKNTFIENKDSADDDVSAMETVVDEETETFTDHSKDDNDERISNVDHPTDIGYKPYKCPMCEKSFAQDRYCRKHVRRVHYKKNMKNKSPVFDPNNSSVTGTLIETENRIMKSQNYLKNKISNMNAIVNIGNEPETTDCLNDIDDANASVDFANVKLENYIFSEQRDTPMDIVPSMPDRKYLLNDDNNSNDTINKHLYKENTDSLLIRKEIMYDNKGNATIETELVNENGEAITLVEKDLFNANSKENVTVEKELYNGNNQDNDNPIDILEYIAEMPENNSLFVPVMNQEALTGNAQPPTEAVTYPCEYGPEFSASFDAPCTTGFIDLDDHMLPHIDPLLTINNQTCVMQGNYSNYDYDVIDAAHLLALGTEAYNKTSAQTDQAYGEYNVTVAAAGYEPGWDPPIITKLCDQYGYGYGEMPEASRVPIMNTDIF